MEGLKRQIEALTQGKNLPTWPVLIQREVRPEYTGWSRAFDFTEEDLTPERFDESTVTLYDVRVSGDTLSEGRQSVAHLILEAE